MTFAISFCGSEDGYIEVLEIYIESVEQKAADIEGFYKDEDYENYTIQVHSLKSTSKLVGAMDISERAKELEKAGNENDVELIKANTEDLLRDFRELGKRLAEVFAEEEDEPSEEELTDISDDMLKDAYNTLSQFAAMMDYEDAVFVLNELQQYRVPEEEKERLERIHEAVERLDWEMVSSCLAELA